MRTNRYLKPGLGWAIALVVLLWSQDAVHAKSLGNSIIATGTSLSFLDEDGEFKSTRFHPAGFDDSSFRAKLLISTEEKSLFCRFTPKMRIENDQYEPVNITKVIYSIKDEDGTTIGTVSESYDFWLLPPWTYDTINSNPETPLVFEVSPTQIEKNDLKADGDLPMEQISPIKNPRIVDDEGNPLPPTSAYRPISTDESVPKNDVRKSPRQAIDPVQRRLFNYLEAGTARDVIISVEGVELGDVPSSAALNLLAYKISNLTTEDFENQADLDREFSSYRNSHPYFKEVCSKEAIDSYKDLKVRWNAVIVLLNYIPVSAYTESTLARRTLREILQVNHLKRVFNEYEIMDQKFCKNKISALFNQYKALHATAYSSVGYIKDYQYLTKVSRESYTNLPRAIGILKAVDKRSPYYMWAVKRAQELQVALNRRIARDQREKQSSERQRAEYLKFDRDKASAARRDNEGFSSSLSADQRRLFKVNGRPITITTNNSTERGVLVSWWYHNKYYVFLNGLLVESQETR